MSRSSPPRRPDPASRSRLVFDNTKPSLTVTDPNQNSAGLDSSGITLARGSQQIVVSDSKVSVNHGALEVQ